MCFRPPIKLYNILKDPFAQFLPENSAYCTRPEINGLHRQTCDHLEIQDIYPEILWSFTNKLKKTLAEAVYWKNPGGVMQWRINYDTKCWIAMGTEGRKNTIIHEVCHLAVEKIHGHNARPKKDEVAVLDHGEQWQALMLKCGEEPFLDNPWRYR
jgi:hypothetical protein